MNALALVIGNNDYVLEKNKLDNAVNDAKSVAETLLRLGFVVQNKLECDKSKFANAISEFTTELENYEVGLFFFSGHGIQVDGENYLAPIDADFTDEKVAKYTSFSMDSILSDMEKASPKIKIIILDACRNNPFSATFRGLFIKGLAPIYAPKGTIIAYSTSPGETAMDGGGGKHSIYTKSLLKHIKDKNIQIEDFFKRVRTSVYALSEGKQLSWEHTSLIGDYYFNSGQLIHAIDLPYSDSVVADSQYIPDGSEASQIIEKFKKNEWSIQKSAFNEYKKLSKNDVEINLQFLLGRNILQTAEGGEFSTIAYINNLGNNINDWTVNNENHILNGILYEIYFDSKGRFRQGMNFKSLYIEEIFKLEFDKRFYSAFSFINEQLQPFRDYLFYIPSIKPVNLPLELSFKKLEKEEIDDENVLYKLDSIFYQGVDILQITEEHSFYIASNYDKFIEDLSRRLCAPQERLTISTNFEDELKTVGIPAYFKITPK